MSHLTAGLKDKKYRLQNAHSTFYDLIKGRYNNNATAADAVYSALTNMDKQQTVCCIKTHLCHLPCEPALNALTVWSKIKFNIIVNDIIPKDLRILLLGFARQIEDELERGLLRFFGNRFDIMHDMTYDDFCIFALTLISRPSVD